MGDIPITSCHERSDKLKVMAIILILLKKFKFIKVK